MHGSHGGIVQAWFSLIAEDPEVFSALSVVRARLAAGRSVLELRRARLMELRGSRRDRDDVEALMRASTQFYNPHKEHCELRGLPGDPITAPPGAQLLLVTERDATRRVAAERWWHHDTGETVEVREGVVWMLRFPAGTDAAAAARELGTVRDARHGLFANPHAEELQWSELPAPLPWLDAGDDGEREGGLR